jgi:hypothetical protein
MQLNVQFSKVCSLKIENFRERSTLKPTSLNSPVRGIFAPVKKLLSILCLLTLLFISGGYHFYYSLQRAAVKMEMKKNISALDRSAVKIFRFLPEEFKVLQWEDECEFKWKGTWYDVVDITDSNGVKSVSCIADEKETALLNSLMKADENAHHKGITIIKLITQDFIWPQAAISIIPVINKTDFNIFELKFRSQYKRQPSQPPEFC